ncbi:MAG: alpha/beta hydrolase [Ilumatobacteraceae bacterium]
MPLHIQTIQLVELYKSLGAPPIETQSPDAVRAQYLSGVLPSEEQVAEIRAVDAGGIPARLYRPRTDIELGLYIYFHGGGWVIGDLETHDDVCRAIANRSGHAVLSIDYRLAPEFPFPTPLTDCLVATRWAYDHASDLGCDPKRLAVGGDSAGGNLAIVVAMETDVPLRCQILAYPVTDATQQHHSYEENADGPLLTKAGMTWFLDHYLVGDGSPTDPRVSPLLASDAALAKLPPTLVITAEFDPLRDEGEAFAARLSLLGVPTSSVRYAGQIHGFISMPRFLDDAHSARALIGTTLSRALDAH